MKMSLRVMNKKIVLWSRLIFAESEMAKAPIHAALSCIECIHRACLIFIDIYWLKFADRCEIGGLSASRFRFN